MTTLRTCPACGTVQSVAAPRPCLHCGTDTRDMTPAETRDYVEHGEYPATNLDSMDDADLREYVRVHGVSSPYGATELSRYASLLLLARTYRRTGRIQHALNAEIRADAIYASLPEALKW